MSFTMDDLKRVIWTFLMTFVAVFVATAQGWATLPSLDAVKAAAVSAGTAALAAAFSFVKNLLLNDSGTGVHALK
jgi:hypothetical protein